MFKFAKSMFYQKQQQSQYLITLALLWLLIIHTELVQFYEARRESQYSNEAAVLNVMNNYIEPMFQTIQSSYQISRYIEDCMPFVCPEKIILGYCQKTGKPRYQQYVSIREVLFNLLQQDTIFAETLHYLNETPHQTLYTDIKDGTEYITMLNKANHEANEHILSLIFYTVEFEVCNPIGGSKKKHKIAAVYFTIACLPPQYRSKRKYMFLSSLMYDNYSCSLIALI